MSICCTSACILLLSGRCAGCADVDASSHLQSPEEGSSAEENGSHCLTVALPLDALPQRRMQPSRNWLDDGDVSNTALLRADLWLPIALQF